MMLYSEIKNWLKNFKLKVSHILFATAAVVLAVTAVYGVRYWGDLSAKKSDIENAKTQIAKFQEQKEKVHGAYADALNRSKATQSEIKKRLEAIMPYDEAFTDLTRELDNFFEKNYKPNEVFIAGSLNFGKPTIPKEDVGYAILPFSMNIESSLENFNKFLEFVTKSGTLESMTRLMDIESIRLNFGGEEKEKITFSVNMRAYFQYAL